MIGSYGRMHIIDYDNSIVVVFVIFLEFFISPNKSNIKNGHAIFLVIFYYHNIQVFKKDSYFFHKIYFY